MKYFDVNTVANSYVGFQKRMTNKSWGYLALLKGCKGIVRPSTPYEVDLNIVSNFLEGCFNLSQNKKEYDGGRSLYVVFSNKWDEYFNDQGISSPNIYDVIVWAYRRRAFSDNVSDEILLKLFSEEFNIPVDVITNSFDTQKKDIILSEQLYLESELATELSKKGVDVSSNNIDAKKARVVASPGEISRGPFVQTLYAGLDITEYVIILQSNYYTLYGNNKTSREGEKPSSLQENSYDVYSSYRPYITAIKSKPFLLLAGISGTGKSRIVREFAFKSCPKKLQDKDGTTPGNYCMIEVKPNWHDSTELLGYYSNLNQKYQFTKFVKFLVKAKMFHDVPFFVCLDEMNLAPVEQYFAEILSILETRKHPKGDPNTIKTEAIVEARYFQELELMKGMRHSDTGEPFMKPLTDRDIYLKLYGIDTENAIDKEVGERQDLTTEGLTLPDNVIIIGTVNMDDTTHQFSRKVIDRAMTIEMNGGKLADMYGGNKDLEYLDEEEQQKWQQAFKQHYVTADEVLEKHPEMAKDITEKLPQRLEEINQVLKGTPFEVSYRVLNELTIMVGVMLDEKGEEANIDDVINQAVENILLMKILPRIEGDSEMFAIKGKNETRLDLLKEIAPTIEPTEEGEHHQTAKEKIQEMIDRLENQEFTRFWP